MGGVDRLKKYLLQNYDDKINVSGTSKARHLDPVEAMAFIREEGIECKQDGDKCIPTDDGIKKWLKVSSLREKRLKKVTPKDFRKVIMPAISAPVVPEVKNETGPIDILKLTTLKDYELTEAKKIVGMTETKKKEKYQTIYVGNAQVPSNHDSDVRRYARPSLPTEREYFIPAKSDGSMKFHVRLRNVDYHEGATERLKRPTHVWIVPSDFRFPLPENGGPEDIKLEHISQWMRTSKRGHKNKRVEELMAYFKKFTPKKGNTSTFDVEMPAAEYQIIAVSGEAEKQKGVKDHFDNIAIDISGENTRLDPVLGADPGATVVLGEELSKITRITDDGSREPIPGALPSTADSGKYLYPEAYIKYHPMSRNPNAEIDRDKRSFRVKPGRQYIFRAKISGIDNGGRIIISHGKKKEVVHFTQAAIVRIEKNHIETKKPPRPSNGAAVDKWANLAGKGIVPERFIMETEIKDHRGVVMGVIGQDPEGNKFKIWVDNINDEYFVSCFRFNEKRDLFEMQKRVHTGDWLSAWSIFRSYTRARWMKTLDFELIDRNRSGRNWFLTSDERTKKKSDKKTSAHLSRGTSIARGSKKLIEISFTPKKSTISIEFESTGNHYHCDEIRFDDIGVTEIDGKTGEAKGDVIRAYK